MKGRVVVITGGASGIGRATAVAFANAGASVVVGDVDEVGLDETAQLTGATAVPTDVTSSASVDALVAAAVQQHGRIDVMANIAGIIAMAPIVELTEDELDRVLAVNLKGVVFGTQAAMRSMQSGGSIVNMTSTAIDQASPTLGAYAMSKAAVAMLTKTAAVEGGKAGIRVNAVAPGFVLSPMTERSGPERTQAMLEMMRKRSPIGATGMPEDIAAAVLYLASDAARYVTGQVLRVNGGTSMPW
ncbi:MAG: 3-oxoacyl-[acyl-carrier protein] reductase [Actinomycetota bacterium]